MIIRFILPGVFGALVFVFYPISSGRAGSGANLIEQAEHRAVFVSETSEHEAEGKILVEMFLAREHKERLNEIKAEFDHALIRRFRIQFFRLGHPPENIAFGRNVPADLARLAIQIAHTYNDGIKFILAEFRFPVNYIAIGTSAFDEASQIPIAPEDVKRLSDPSLTTPEFHALYRELTGEVKQQFSSPESRRQ